MHLTLDLKEAGAQDLAGVVARHDFDVLLEGREPVSAESDDLSVGRAEVVGHLLDERQDLELVGLAVGVDCGVAWELVGVASVLDLEL